MPAVARSGHVPVELRQSLMRRVAPAVTAHSDFQHIPLNRPRPAAQSKHKSSTQSQFGNYMTMDIYMWSH